MKRRVLPHPVKKDWLGEAIEDWNLHPTPSSGAACAPRPGSCTSAAGLIRDYQPVCAATTHAFGALLQTGQQCHGNHTQKLFSRRGTTPQIHYHDLIERSTRTLISGNSSL